MVPGDTITLKDLAFLGGPGGVKVQESPAELVPLHEARDAFEREYILKALAAQRKHLA